MTRTKKESYDVLIGGGGFIGGMLAVALAARGCEVAVIDQKDPHTPPAADGRTFAIALGSQCLLAAWGIWERLEKKPCPIRHILITDHKSPHRLHYDAKKLSEHPMGYMVEAEDLEKALRKSVLASPRVHLVAPDDIVDFKTSLSQAQITLASGRHLEAPLVVAADGKNSRLRDLAGLSAKTIPYHQKAIVGVLQHEGPHHHIAFEHFTPFGPLALLPLWEHQSAFVWSLEDAKVEDMMRLNEAAFGREVEAVFGDVLGSLTLVAPRKTYPLSLTTCRQMTSDRLVLVGDAANAMHPVAGQGLNLGIRDIGSLTGLLLEAKRLRLDLGSVTLLSRYVASRRWDQTSLLSSTHGLIRLFGNSSRALRFLRGTGMSIVESLPPLKRLLMKRAMGVA